MLYKFYSYEAQSAQLSQTASDEKSTSSTFSNVVHANAFNGAEQSPTVFESDLDFQKLISVRRNSVELPKLSYNDSLCLCFGETNCQGRLCSLAPRRLSFESASLDLDKPSACDESSPVSSSATADSDYDNQDFSSMSSQKASSFVAK